MKTKTNQAADNVATETKFKLTDKVKIINHERIYERYNVIFKKLGFKNVDKNVIPKSELKGTWEVFGMSKHEFLNKTLVAIKKGAKELLIQDIGLRLIESSQSEPAKLKNTTQQKRVELIETQKWELIAATATIDSQAATINELNRNINNIEKSRSELIEQNDELSETCGNLVRAKMRNDSTIADLTKRNGNLKTLVNDQTERIEVMQHELKNYESAVTSLEGINYSLNKKLDKFEEFNKHLVENETKATESRERLASKFTNWFIFLVSMLFGAISYNVYLLLTK